MLFVLPVALFIGAIGWGLICLDSKRSVEVRKASRARSCSDQELGASGRRAHGRT